MENQQDENKNLENNEPQLPKSKLSKLIDLLKIIAALLSYPLLIYLFLQIGGFYLSVDDILILLIVIYVLNIVILIITIRKSRRTSDRVVKTIADIVAIYSALIVIGGGIILVQMGACFIGTVAIG